jgi:hypothetical protein
MAPALSGTSSPFLVTSSPSLEIRSRFVVYHVALSSQEMTPFFLLNYLSFSRLLGHFLPRDEATVSVALPVASSPSLAKQSRFVAFSLNMTPLCFIASSLFLNRRLLLRDVSDLSVALLVAFSQR